MVFLSVCQNTSHFSTDLYNIEKKAKPDFSEILNQKQLSFHVDSKIEQKWLENPIKLTIPCLIDASVFISVVYIWLQHSFKEAAAVFKAKPEDTKNLLFPQCFVPWLICPYCSNLTPYFYLEFIWLWLPAYFYAHLLKMWNALFPGISTSIGGFLLHRQGISDPLLIKPKRLSS